jgi:hypothetical protein
MPELLPLLAAHPIDLRLGISQPMVASAVMAHRKQEAALQVLHRGLESNGAARRSTTQADSNILAQHGPSWAKGLDAKHDREPIFPDTSSQKTPASEDLGLSWPGRFTQVLEKPDLPVPVLRIICSGQSGYSGKSDILSSGLGLPRYSPKSSESVIVGSHDLFLTRWGSCGPMMAESTPGVPRVEQVFGGGQSVGQDFLGSLAG